MDTEALTEALTARTIYAGGAGRDRPGTIAARSSALAVG